MQPFWSLETEEPVGLISTTCARVLPGMTNHSKPMLYLCFVFVPLLAYAQSSALPIVIRGLQTKRRWLAVSGGSVGTTAPRSKRNWKIALLRGVLVISLPWLLWAAVLEQEGGQSYVVTEVLAEKILARRFLEHRKSKSRTPWVAVSC